MIWLAAALLGLAAGLRTVTPPAVLWLERQGGVAAYVLAAAALFEYAMDLNPKAPPRTWPPTLVIRLVSGAFCGWVVAGRGGGLAIAAALVALGGVLVGAYGGLAVRRRAIETVGPIFAGLIEDLVAIVFAVAGVAAAGV
jgi:uncharacterized membrane protein